MIYCVWILLMFIFRITYSYPLCIAVTCGMPLCKALINFSFNSLKFIHIVANTHTQTHSLCLSPSRTASDSLEYIHIILCIEVSTIVWNCYLLKCDTLLSIYRTVSNPLEPSLQALLADTYSVRDTKVHENGKVSRFTVNASTLIFSYTDTHTHNPTLSIYLCLSLSEHIHLIKRMRRKQNDISKFDLLFSSGT